MKSRKILQLTTSLVLFFLLSTSINFSTANTIQATNIAIDSEGTSTGLLQPRETLFSSSWGSNSTANPLGVSNRDAIFSSNPLAGNYLKGINYNTNIDPDATIHGIEVMIEHATWNGNDYWANISVELEWNGRSSVTTTGTWDYVSGAVNSGWNDNFRNVTLGSPTDTWGRTWSGSDLSNDNFAVRISLLDVHGSASESVDIAWIKVHYSPAQEDASISLNQETDLTIRQDQLNQINFDWYVTFFHGDRTDVGSSVEVHFLFNNSEFNLAEGRVNYANNSIININWDTSIYQAGNYMGTLDQLLGGVAYHNVTIVTILYDITGNIAVVERDSVGLTILEAETVSPSIWLSQAEGGTYNVGNLVDLYISWDTSFSHGSETNLAEELRIYILINATAFTTAEQTVSISNNTAFTLSYDTSLYSDQNYVGSLYDYLVEPNIYNITIVAQLFDIDGQYVKQSTSDVLVTVEASETSGNEPYISGVPTYFEFQITLDNSLIVSLRPSLLNSSSYDFTNLALNIYMNESLVEILEWTNNTEIVLNISQYIQETGFYVFEVELSASTADVQVSATMLVELTVTESETTSETTESEITSESDTNNTNSTDSVSIPQLELNYPSPIFILLLGIFIPVLRRRNQ